VALRHPAERRLVLRLLLADGAPLPVERLTHDLGQDRAEANGSAVFERVDALRRRLEPGRPAGTPARVLATTPGGYALAGAGLIRDDLTAARLVGEARAELAAGRAGAAGERAAGALALWRGPVLLDAGDAAWALHQRDRLAALADEARLVAAAALAVDRPAAAGPALDEAQAGRPGDGRLWALRAATALALERDVEALQVLRRARLALEGDGVDRGPALRAMEAAVLRADHRAARALCLHIALGGFAPDLVSQTVAGDAVGHQIQRNPDLVSQTVAGDAVGHQIRGLPPRCRRLVELLALASTSPGDDTGLDLLARAAGLPSASVVDQLDPAVALGLVVVSPAGARFRQPAAGPAALAGLTPFRLRCHRHLVAQARRGGPG